MSDLQIPVQVLENVLFKYNQTCKRAKNLIDYLRRKMYVIEEQKRFSVVSYEVNCFGHAFRLTGDKDTILEKLLEMDKISVEDYELLSFFYDTEDAGDFIYQLYKRSSEGVVNVDKGELDLLLVLSNFEESNELPKEAYLV